MNIFAGNLAEDVTDADLRTLFAAHGQVTSASVVKDRFSDRSKGFGFVEMANEVEGRAAIKALNGADLKGSQIIVNVARSRGEAGAPSGGGYRRQSPSRA
jgi:RNA recognition motif-containing protein